MAVRTIAAFQRFSRSGRIVAAQRDRNCFRVPFPTRPRSVQWTRSGPFSPLQVVVAPLKPRGMPCRIPSMSQLSRLRTDAWKRRWIASGACCYGLVAQTVCCRDRPARLRGRRPAGGTGGLLPHCRRIAALPLRDRGAVRSPRGSCLRSGTSPWPAGNQVGPVGVALAGGSLQVTLCADVAAPEAAVAPGTLRVT